MEKFVSIRIKESTAREFKTFSKSMAKIHSLALAKLLLFFEKRGLSPYEDCADTMRWFEGGILKRIDGLIAILKNIEKAQTRPAHLMILALLEGSVNETGQIQKEENIKYSQKI